MSYGLVRQIGPWKMTGHDVKKILLPPDLDPSDYQTIRPGNVRAGNTQPIARSTIAERSIYLPPADDPRVSIPGRRISINRALGSKREPLEGKGVLTALSGGGALQMKLDPVTGDVITDQPSLLQPPVEKRVVKPDPLAPQGPLPKRKQTPEEQGADIINFIADVIPYAALFIP